MDVFGDFLSKNLLCTITAVGLLFLLVLFGAKLDRGLKKALYFVLTVLVTGLIYSFTSGTPFLSIPGKINKKLSQTPSSQESQNPHYYQSPEKRYGRQLE
jgi:purine-cytosine permease-like protein